MERKSSFLIFKPKESIESSSLDIINTIYTTAKNKPLKSINDVLKVTFLYSLLLEIESELPSIIDDFTLPNNNPLDYIIHSLDVFFTIKGEELIEVRLQDNFTISNYLNVQALLSSNSSEEILKLIEIIFAFTVISSKKDYYLDLVAQLDTDLQDAWEEALSRVTSIGTKRSVLINSDSGKISHVSSHSSHSNSQEENSDEKVSEDEEIDQMPSDLRRSERMQTQNSSGGRNRHRLTTSSNQLYGQLEKVKLLNVIDRLRLKMEESNEERNNILEQLKNYEIAKQEDQHSQFNYEQTIEDLTAKIRELERESNNNGLLSEERFQLNEAYISINEYERKLSQKAMELDAMQQSNALDAKKFMERIKYLENNLKTMETIRQENGELKEYNKHLKEKNKDLSDLKDAKFENDTLKNMNYELEKTIERNQLLINDLNGEIGIKDEMMKTLTHDIISHKDVIAELREEILHLQKQFNEVAEKNNEYRIMLAHQEKKIERTSTNNLISQLGGLSLGDIENDNEENKPIEITNMGELNELQEALKEKDKMIRFLNSTITLKDSGLFEKDKTITILSEELKKKTTELLDNDQVDRKKWEEKLMNETRRLLAEKDILLNQSNELNATYSNEIKRHKVEMKKRESIIKHKTKDNKALEDDIQMKKEELKQVTVLTQQKHKLIEEADHKEKEIIDLRNRIVILDNDVKVIPTLKAEIDILGKEYQMKESLLKKEIEMLRNDIEELNKIPKEIVMTKDISEAKVIEELNEIIARLNNELAALKNEYNNAQLKVKEVIIEINTLQKKYEKEQRSLIAKQEDEKKIMKEDYDHYKNDMINKHSKEILSKENEVKEIMEEQAKLQHFFEMQKEKIADKFNKEKTKLQAQLESMKQLSLSEKKTFNSTKISYENKIKALENQLSTLQLKSTKDNASLQNEVKKLQQDLFEKGIEIALLNKQLMDKERLLQEKERSLKSSMMSQLPLPRYKKQESTEVTIMNSTNNDKCFNWDKEVLFTTETKIKYEEEPIQVYDHSQKDYDELKFENINLKAKIKKISFFNIEKVKLQLEAMEQREKIMQSTINKLTIDKKYLEKQVENNLEMYLRENSKRDADIEFLVLALTEMKHKQAKEYEFVYDSIDTLTANILLAQSDFNNHSSSSLG